jgi:cell division protein FtsL
MAQETEKIKAPTTRSAKWVSLSLVLMGIFLCEMLTYTWCRVQCTQAGYEISRVTGEQKQLTTVQKKLQVELARLKSPERLAKLAKGYLGLNMPSSRQVVVVK